MWCAYLNQSIISTHMTAVMLQDLLEIFHSWISFIWHLAKSWLLSSWLMSVYSVLWFGFNMIGFISNLQRTLPGRTLTFKWLLRPDVKNVMAIILRLVLCSSAIAILPGLISQCTASVSTNWLEAILQFWLVKVKIYCTKKHLMQLLG